MKKAFIAIAVAAITTGAQAAEVYTSDSASLEIGGRAEARLATAHGKTQDKTRARINVKGTSDINDSLYALGFYEMELTDNTQDDKLETRYSYAGLGGGFGEIVYGKTKGSLAQITDFTDIMVYHSDSAIDKIAVGDRANNMMAYSKTLGDVTVLASYKFDEQDPSSKDDKSGKGFSTSFVFGVPNTGVSFGAGVAEEKDMLTQAILGASLEMSAFYLGATVMKQDVKAANTMTTSKDETGYDVVAAFSIDNTRLSALYSAAKEKQGDKKDRVAAEVKYDFNRNFVGFTSINYDLVDKDKGLALGMKYTF